MQKLSKILSKEHNSKISEIVKTSNELKELTIILRNILEINEKENLISAAIQEDGNLILTCSSSVWASKLRFKKKKLLSEAKKAGFNASNLEVSVLKRI